MYTKKTGYCTTIADKYVRLHQIERVLEEGNYIKGNIYHVTLWQQPGLGKLQHRKDFKSKSKILGKN